MKSQTIRNRLPSLIVGSLIVFWIATVLAGWHSALGLSDHAAFIILLAAGITLCATGMEIQRYGWMNPFNLLGSLIGVGILLLVIAVFADLSSDRSAFLALSALMGLKVAIDLLRGLFTRHQPAALAE